MDLESLFKARGANPASEVEGNEAFSAKPEFYDPITALREYAKDISKEDELGNILVKRQLISEKHEREAYAHLEENSRNVMSPIPLSMIYELSGMEHLNIDRIINRLVIDYKMPYLSIKNFKIKPEIIAMLPPDAGERLGIALFGGLESSAQVACLNPLRKHDLTEMLKECLKRHDIFFFLTRPEYITGYYDRLRKQLTEL